jgi:serine/threonine protein kinase
VVKLADFGTAKNNTASLNAVAESFTGGNHVGTSIYMAPEVMIDANASGQTDKAALSPSKIDALKTDIWSLACSIVEMASGSMPFPSQAVAVYQVCIKGCPPTTPECLSEEGADFLAQAFELNPGTRPGAEELRFLPFCDFSEETMSRPEFLRTSNTTTNLMLEELISGNSQEYSEVWKAETKSSSNVDGDEILDLDAKWGEPDNVILSGDGNDNDDDDNFGFVSDAPTLSSHNETLTNW